METEKLKEYLGIVVDMEQDIFLKNQLIKQLSNQIAVLGKEQIILEPREPVKQSPPENSFRAPAEPKMQAPTRAAIAFGVTTIILLFYVLSSGTRYLSYTLSPIFALGCIAAGVTYAMNRDADARKQSAYKKEMNRYENYIRDYHAQCKKIEQNNQRNLAKYQKDLEVYRRDIANDQLRVISEEIKCAALKVEVERLQTQKQRSQKVLNKIYSENIIFPKYRNLVMVCSLYEYICAGRCDTLEGHDGAYNILEIEIRLDHIITRLDRIIAMLDRIQENQYVVYHAIQETNQRLEMIGNGIGQIVTEFQNTQAAYYRMSENMQENLREVRENNANIRAQFADLQESSALVAYHAERIQKELHYMNRMNYLTGRNDGPFQNTPPN